MENNDNDLQRQPLIPEQRQQGKTVQTILIKKMNWTHWNVYTTSLFYQLYREILSCWLHGLNWMLLINDCKERKRNTCMTLVSPIAISQFNVNKNVIFLDEKMFKWFSPYLGWVLFFFFFYLFLKTHFDFFGWWKKD